MTRKRPRFFKPTEAFFEWLHEFARGRVIFEAGAGEGLLVQELLDHGEKAVGLDIMVTSQPYPIGPPMIETDATTHRYPKGSIVIIARPNRGVWIEETIKQAIRCGCDVVYVGKSELISPKKMKPYYHCEYWKEDITWLFDWTEVNCEVENQWAKDKKDRPYSEDNDVVVVIRKKTIMEMIQDRHHTDLITERIPRDFGTSMEFEFEGSYYDKAKKGWAKTTCQAITGLPSLLEGKRMVHGYVYDYLYSMNAQHYYAKLDVSSIPCTVLEPILPGDDSIGVHMGAEPVEARGFSLECRVPARHDGVSISMAMGDTPIKKGEITHQFATWEEAFDAMWSEFDRVFGEEEWVLVKRCREERWSRDAKKERKQEE